MCTRNRVGAAALVLGLVAFAVPILSGVQLRPLELEPGDALTWRAMGPRHAGPTTAIAGDPVRHGVFYAGSTGAGLWKTTDFGANWRPVFDAPPSGMVSAIAVATSTPDLIYVATPGNSSGNLHRSTDGGHTWTPAPVPTPHPLVHIALDPSDARRLFVTTPAGDAADNSLGIFRSIDAGATFTRVLGLPGNHSGAAVFIHPRRPLRVVAIGRPDTGLAGAASTLQVSSDGGTTWEAARGLPALDTRAFHADLAFASNDVEFLLLATGTDATLMRSDDAGSSWTATDAVLPSDVRTAPQPRVAVSSRGTLFIAAGPVFVSHDAGRTFAPAVPPAGHLADRVWAHPGMPGVRMLAGTRGAIITVNDGETWSSPDALPTAVVDRVTTDTSFPYRICATAADIVTCGPGRTDPSGSGAGWQPLPPELTGFVASDPLDAEVVFGGAGFRHDRRTGQTVNVDPAAMPGSAPRPSFPLTFSADGRTLFTGTGAVWRTINGGLVWTAVSPQLSTPSARISAVSVSPIAANTIWAGLSSGRLHVTRDAGSTWTEATLPAAAALSMIRDVEPSRFDPNSAYVVLSRSPGTGAGSLPHLLRTRDAGATWTDLGARMGNAGTIHVVREDPLRRGLLFAGTDHSIFVSFDDGERWQRMALNLPATPVRDLLIKDADLVAATRGRGVWLLEDLSPLRQVTADVLGAELFLFRPAQTWRVRATRERSPRGSAADADSAQYAGMLTYLLGAPAQDEVTLEVIETTTGDVIRRFAGRPGAGPQTAGSVALATSAGLHRVAWDLRYAPPVPGVAGAAPGTVVLPGTYQVRLTVDGRSVRQAITIRMDPRIRTSMVDLTAQRDLGRALDAARAAVHAARTSAPAPAGTPRTGLTEMADELDRLARALQQADVRPVPRLESAIEVALERTAMALGADTR